MKTDIEKVTAAIEARAHEIWIEEGRPEGRDKAHWIQAENELKMGSDSLVTHTAPGGTTPMQMDNGAAVESEGDTNAPLGDRITH